MLATAVYFGVFGEIYSLFPGDQRRHLRRQIRHHQQRHVVHREGTASLLVPLASLVAARYGWQAVFIIAVALNATAALMAMFVIKPMRRAFILGNEAAVGRQGARRHGPPDRRSHCDPERGASGAPLFFANLEYKIPIKDSDSFRPSAATPGVDQDIRNVNITAAFFLSRVRNFARSN